jgi:hypothetical protein
MAGYNDFRRSLNVEDRRDSPDMTPEWKNVPGSLTSIATSLGNYLWGTPALPEAPDTSLSDALGKRDIRIVPHIGNLSPLDRAINTATDEVSVLRSMLGYGKPLGSDTPFTQREFSKGYGSPVYFAPQTADKIIGVESGGNPNATNPNSSATGARSVHQFNVA